MSRLRQRQRRHAQCHGGCCCELHLGLCLSCFLLLRVLIGPFNSEIYRRYELRTIWMPRRVPARTVSKRKMVDEVELKKGMDQLQKSEHAHTHTGREGEEDMERQDFLGGQRPPTRGGGRPRLKSQHDDLRTRHPSLETARIRRRGSESRPSHFDVGVRLHGAQLFWPRARGCGSRRFGCDKIVSECLASRQASGARTAHMAWDEEPGLGDAIVTLHPVDTCR